MDIIKRRQYELTNHLGNVLATIKDEKKQISANGTTVDYYEPIVLTATDYYPFGMPMPNRQYSLSSGYRFGFNTQEKDDEIYGQGNSYTAKYWQYDARIGRRWNLDPVYNASESRYLVNGGNPIWYNDPFGDYKSKLGARLGNLFKKGEIKQAGAGKHDGEWYFSKGKQSSNAKINSDGSFELGVTESRPDYGNGGVADKAGSYLTGAGSALGSFAKFAFGGGGNQSFDQYSFESQEMANSPGVQKGLQKLGNKSSDKFNYSFSPSPKGVVNDLISGENPIGRSISSENIEAHKDVFNNQSWTRLYVGGYAGTMRVVNGNQVEVVIRNNTTANSLMLHLGELIYGDKEGANKFDNFWNSTPFFNTLKQEYKFTVPIKTK